MDLYGKKFHEEMLPVIVRYSPGVDGFLQILPSLAERSIIATGSKGGVRTATMALNVAVHRAQLAKKRVGLIEFARPFGQISLMLDFDPRFTLLDALQRIGSLHAALRAEQRRLVTLETLLRLLELAREAFGLVVVDLGFVNAAEWARVLQSTDTLVLVAEPSALALGMLERYLKAVDSAGLDRDRFQIIINRWRQNDDKPVARFEKDLKRSFFARLPNVFRQVSEAVTLGIPRTASSNNPLVGRYRDLAARLMGARQRSNPVPTRNSL
jgi:Flp pilus assembly CpaE family ATPase